MDFLNFKIMILPAVIKVISGTALILFPLIAIEQYFTLPEESRNVPWLIIKAVLAPLAVRLICETLIVVFRIHEELVSQHCDSD